MPPPSRRIPLTSLTPQRPADLSRDRVRGRPRVSRRVQGHGARIRAGQLLGDAQSPGRLSLSEHRRRASSRAHGGRQRFKLVLPVKDSAPYECALPSISDTSSTASDEFQRAVRSQRHDRDLHLRRILQPRRLRRRQRRLDRLLGQAGPELLEHRLALYREEQRMVFGANTFRAFVRMLASSTEDSEVRDPWVARMVNLPATVVSKTLKGPLSWPDATVVSGDAVEVVARLKEESQVPLRSHGSLSLNRALMAAGLVDFVQVTLFPVITGQTGLDPIFQDAADFDLQLVDNRTLDGHVQELIYRPTLH